MGTPIFGPSSKLDSSGEFVPNPSRRPLAGIDQAILYHRGSLVPGGVLTTTPDQGSRGPDFWDATKWGSPGAVAHRPRILIVSYGDISALRAWVDSVFDSVFVPLGVSIVAIPVAFQNFVNHEFPFLAGVPVKSVTDVAQASLKDFVSIPNLVDPGLYICGDLFIAIVTDSRVTWLSGNGGAAQTEDFVIGGTDGGSPFEGYDQYTIGSGPDPNDGFTVFTKDAVDQLSKLRQFIPRCRSFRSVFYQSTDEATRGSFNSSIVPEEAMSALLGGDPHLFRVKYDPADIDALLSRIRDDATTFFS